MVDRVKECVTFTRSNGGKSNPEYYIRIIFYGEYPVGLNMYWR